jgi:hypothetical protein
MKWLLALLLLQQSAADTYAAVALDAGCKDNVGCAGFYRAFVATTTPVGSTFGPPSTVTGISAAAIGVQAATNGTIGAANVDVAGFKFKNPADTSDGANNAALSVYYGYLGVTGVWNNKTQTGAIAGAFLEIVSAISSIQVYYDRDGQPGFQWDLSKTQNDIYVCGAGSFDCIDTKGNIGVTSLIWGDIDRAVLNCSAVVSGGGYDDNCTIQTFTTSGALTAGGAPVLTIVARTASQPIEVNGVLITPLKVKFDVDVSVPWTNLTQLSDAANAKIALVFVHAGKSGKGDAIASTTGSGTNVVSSLVFNGDKGYAAYYGYKSSATVDGNSATVYSEAITGDQILGFKGTGITALVVAVLSIYIKFYQAFGWVVSLSIHSFDQKHPTTINWDPEVGMTNATAVESASTMLAPCAAIALLALLN